MYKSFRVYPLDLVQHSLFLSTQGPGLGYDSRICTVHVQHAVVYWTPSHILISSFGCPILLLVLRCTVPHEKIRRPMNWANTKPTLQNMYIAQFTSLLSFHESYVTFVQAHSIYLLVNLGPGQICHIFMRLTVQAGTTLHILRISNIRSQRWTVPQHFVWRPISKR